MTAPEIHSQILGMTGSLGLVRNAAKYSVDERHRALVYAHMHASQAAILVDTDNMRAVYRFRLDDYKHSIRKCIEAVMNGTPLDDALKQLPEWKE